MGDLPNDKILWHFWHEHFNMGVDEKTPSVQSLEKKWLMAERNWWKCGTHGAMYCVCRVLFISDLFHSVWGHSVHFAHFLILLTFSKVWSHNFVQIQPNFREKTCNPGKYRPFLSLAICQNFWPKFMALWREVTSDSYIANYPLPLTATLQIIHYLRQLHCKLSITSDSYIANYPLPLTATLQIIHKKLH